MRKIACVGAPFRRPCCYISLYVYTSGARNAPLRFVIILIIINSVLLLYNEGETSAKVEKQKKLVQKLTFPPIPTFPPRCSPSSPYLPLSAFDYSSPNLRSAGKGENNAEFIMRNS